MEEQLTYVEPPPDLDLTLFLFLSPHASAVSTKSQTCMTMVMGFAAV